MYEKIIFFPVNEVIENAHLGVHFDYWFMGKTDKEMCDLIIQTTIYDHKGKPFIKRSYQDLKRYLVLEHIKTRIIEHLREMGVDPVQISGLMRDFEVDKTKCRDFDMDVFRRPF